MDVLSNSDSTNRDRSRRGDRRTSRFSDADSNNGGGRDRSRDREPNGINKRIIVRNLPADYCWQDLKDIFRRLVGHVDFVDIYNKKNETFAVVEFKDANDVGKAVDQMNGYGIYGKKITVEKDDGNEDYKLVRPIKSTTRRSRQNRDDDMFTQSRGYASGGGGGGGRGGSGGRGSSVNMANFDMPYNTYGLSTSFLESLGIRGPLHTKCFITNLDYNVNAKKVKQIFKLAGKVVNLDLSIDSDGNSRGYGIIEYEHPVEAVQAVSLFDNQLLYDRRMTVRLDRMADLTESFKLPEGLAGIGIGLGPNGEPLRNVAQNLPNKNNQNNNNNNNNNNFNNNMSNMNNMNNMNMNNMNNMNNMSNMNNMNNMNNISNLVGSNMAGNNMAGNNMAGNNMAGNNMTGNNMTGNNMAGNNMARNNNNMNMNMNMNQNSIPAPVQPPAPIDSISLMGINTIGNLDALNDLGKMGNMRGFSNNSSALNNNNSNNNNNNNNSNNNNNNNNMGLVSGGAGVGGGSGISGAGSNIGMLGNDLINPNNSGYNTSSGGGGGSGGNSGGGGGGGFTALNFTNTNSRNDFDNISQNASRGYNTQKDDFQQRASQSQNYQTNDNNNREENSSDTIVIRNLPSTCTWQTLRDKCSEIGEVKFAEIRGQDCGLVRFVKERDAGLALKLMDGARFDGRPVQVLLY